MLSKLARAFVPLTTLAAVLVLSAMLMPKRASGSERRPVAAAAAPDQITFGHDVVIAQPVNGDVQVYGGAGRVLRSRTAAASPET
jgi:hypothetical protein